MAAVGVAGLAAFLYLIVRRYGTPFVVADRIGIGALVFLLGRFLVVALHELAHGLVVSSFGRRVSRAGLKLMLVFPFAFVDTSDGWFEPRRRRFAISAAGPASDLLVGGIFALGAAFVSGTVRDVLFQLAFAAYVGAFSNLNPLLDRDGYHMLVDWLGEPGLRKRRAGAPGRGALRPRPRRRRAARAAHLCRCGACVDDGSCGIRHSDDNALLRSPDLAGSGGGGVGRARCLLPADVRPGARDGRPAAARARARAFRERRCRRLRRPGKPPT